jgi:hypothetical protein
VQLEAELSKINDQIQEDRNELEKFHDPTISESVVGLSGEDEIRAQVLNQEIETMMAQVLQNDLEMDNIITDIDQISEYAAVALSKKSTGIEQLRTLPEIQQPPALKQSRKPKLTKTPQAESVNYGDDEAENMSPVAPTKLSNKRKKKQGSRSAAGRNAPSLFELEEGDENDDDELFVNDASFSPPRQSIKLKTQKSVTDKTHIKPRKSKSQSKHSRLDADSMLAQEVPGPHVIAGEDEEYLEMDIKRSHNKHKLSSKQLPVLVPLDETFVSSPLSKITNDTRKVEKSKTSHGISRSRSPPASLTQKHAQKSRSSKKSKVTQEADWLFSSQDGFSF